MKIIIVGGVAGGASAAARLRRLDEKCEITMYERGEFISFANCGLPYHIGGTIEDREALLVQTPENMSARFNFAVKTFHEVVSIDAKNKKVSVKNWKSGNTFEDNYDYLVLSPGAAPIKPPIPGIDGENIFTLRTIPDMDKIIAAMKKGAKSAIVVGGGFIGVEVAENLIEKGFAVSLVEMQDQVLTFLDPDMAAFAHNEMKSHKIKLYLSDRVTEFKKTAGGKVAVTLASGKAIEADMAVLAIGVMPEVKLAKEAGLKIGETGAIAVGETMLTSDPSIYAVGDAVEVTHFVTKTKIKIPLAGPANRQARIAVNNICGIKSEYKDTQGTSIVKVFDLACGATGASVPLLKRANIAFKTLTLHAGSHAGYYPYAYMVHLKLIYSPETGKILGAQACGYDGVDKRIDVIASAIRHGATVHDLQDYELAYAPPFGSAKDPVNMAGFVAVNDITKFAPLISIFDVKEYKDKGAYLIDVRNTDEVISGSIENSVNIPLHTLRGRLIEIPKDKLIVVYCKVGLRGYIAQRILLQNGFNAVNISGGFESYNTYYNQGDFEHFATGGKDADDTQTKGQTHSQASSGSVIRVNACGLQCPGPLLKLKEAVSRAKDNEVIEIEATDQGFHADVQAFAGAANLKVLDLEKGKSIKARLLKCPAGSVPTGPHGSPKSDQATLVVFSDDFDKAMAATIIANGALAMGKKVSLFFTFWGLNILRKNKNVPVKKNFIEKMFGMMMPRGTSKLTLSKMNMFGMGTQMIKGIMKHHNVEPLEKLLQSVKDNGGKLVACRMSMELMGIKKEEMIDGVEDGGVAAYLADAEKGNINLFI